MGHMAIIISRLRYKHGTRSDKVEIGRELEANDKRKDVCHSHLLEKPRNTRESTREKERYAIAATLASKKKRGYER